MFYIKCETWEEYNLEEEIKHNSEEEINEEPHKKQVNTTA